MSSKMAFMHNMSKRDAKRMIKEQKAKEKQEKQDNQPDPAELKGPRYEDLEIVSVNGALYGTASGQRFRLTNEKGVEVGEVWKCMVSVTPGKLGIETRSAMTLQKIRDAVLEVEEAEALAEVADESPIEDFVEVSSAEGVEPAVETPDVSELLKQIEELKAENRSLTQNLNDSKTRVFELERKTADKEWVEKQCRKMRRAVQSMSTQVRNLEKDRKNVDIGNLRSECESWKKKYEGSQDEIERLRGVIKLLEMNRGTAKQDSTYLTGPTGIHSTLFHDERYRVYFSPGKKILRFIPDEEGLVECRDGSVSIPAIKRFTGFTNIRSMDAVADGDEVVINI